MSDRTARDALAARRRGEAVRNAAQAAVYIADNELIEARNELKGVMQSVERLIAEEEGKRRHRAMYTHIDQTPTGCHTQEGYYTCTACVFRDDPLGCDGFTVEENAQKEYREA